MKNLIKKFIPPFLFSLYHFLWSMIGAAWYGLPSRKLIVIGVTGTNGKTTVVNLSTRILEEAGYKVASLSSIKFKLGQTEWPNTLKMTMPGRFRLQRFLKQAVSTGCDYAVLEVTSEGIKQHRHRFINFDIAVFTNLTPEHIESHGCFEKYKEAKGKFFKTCKNIHIINSDDSNAEYFFQFPAKKKISYSLKNKGLLLPNIRLLGEFNIYNALAAIKIGLSQGIDLVVCQKAIEKLESIPGRMELVIKEPFKVLVDYAHTPDALEKVYKAITYQFINSSANRLICVLGACGGGRDRWKRPKLGEIAAKYCRQIILTNEDPYDENPQHILDQIESGFSKILNSKFQNTKYQKILDRREAIKKALDLAKLGDTVIITGKGSESWMCLASGKKIPWDDRQIVKKEFKKLRESKENSEK